MCNNKGTKSKDNPLNAAPLLSNCLYRTLLSQHGHFETHNLVRAWARRRTAKQVLFQTNSFNTVKGQFSKYWSNLTGRSQDWESQEASAVSQHWELSLKCASWSHHCSTQPRKVAPIHLLKIPAPRSLQQDSKGFINYMVLKTRAIKIIIPL